MPPSVPGRLARWRALPLSIPSPDVNAPDDMGRTRLFHAARGGHTETVWALLRECAADPVGHLPCAALAGGPAQRAFGMALHGRLGRDSLASALPPELLDAVLAACTDPSDVLSAVAARAGHADTAAMLAWLEGLENAAPAYRDANDAARRGAFACPACLGSTDPGEALVLVPCGHRVCRGCWSALGDAHAACAQCGVRVLLAGAPGSFPPARRLRSRFCVEV